MADSLSPMRISVLGGTRSRMFLSSPAVMVRGLLSLAYDGHGDGLFSVGGDGFGLLRAVGGEEHLQRVHGFGLDGDGCVFVDLIKQVDELSGGHVGSSSDGFDGDFVALVVGQDEGEGAADIVGQSVFITAGEGDAVDGGEDGEALRLFGRFLIRLFGGFGGFFDGFFGDLSILWW